MTEPARISLTRPVIVVVALFALALLGLLVTLVVLIADQRTLTEQLQAAGALARTLLDADVERVTRALGDADLPRVADELLTQDRLRRLLVRGTATLGATQALHTVPKVTRAAEAVPRIEAILTESLRVQRETLEQTRQTRALVVELRAIGVETRDLTRTAARSAESLDRKLGGSLPTAAGG